MKQFFKYVLATIVGIVAIGLVMMLIFSIFIGSAISNSSSSDVKVEANSILHLKLNTAINDRVNQSTGYASLLDDDRVNDGLLITTSAIRKAAEDDDIKGIYLDMSSTSIGFANLMSVQRAIDDFKDSGKFVVSYADFITQGAYALASEADEIYVHPEGVFDFRGLSSNVMYFKGMLDKLELEPKIFYAGQFKSATEPLRQKKMSEQNRAQVKEFLNDIYDDYLQEISDNRSMSTEELRDIADNMKVRFPKDAVDLGLITGLKYDDEIDAILRDKVNFDEDEDLNFVTINDYVDSKNIKYAGSDSNSKNRIALVYAEGGIMGGDDDTGIKGDYYRKLLAKLRKNDKIKAVVLRVNSGGGSAFASDKIWREVELLKREKPIVVSMGNVAASGGYYIACNSDKIYAEPTTITGSIGVFATLINSEKFLNNKLGITTDRVMTGKYGDFPSLTREFTAEEDAIMQSMVDDIYEDFLGKVAVGRDMTRDEVHAIAQGRVWSGKDALANGLVDELGSMEDAIAHAAELAEVDSYKLYAYPEVKSSFEKFMEAFDMEARAEAKLMDRLGEYGTYVEELETMMTIKEPQTKMYYDLEIE